MKNIWMKILTYGPFIVALTFLTIAIANAQTHSTGKRGGTSAAAYSNILTMNAQTTTYQILATDDVILASGSAFTVTLPAVASNSGKVIRVRKTDSSLTNIITVKGNASENIDGANTTTLNTQYEEVELICDGSSWHLTNRKIDNSWQAVHTPTTAQLGTVSSCTQYARRDGGNIDLIGTCTLGTTGGGNASISIGFLADADVTVDTAAVLPGSFSGVCTTSANGNNFCTCLAPASNATVFNFGIGASGTNAQTIAVGTAVGASSAVIRYHCKFAVVGWKG